MLFWGIFTPLQWLINQEANRLNWPSYAPLALLLLLMLIWHVHLVFATYAAIVDDHLGIRSVLISIDMTRRRWLMIATAFVGSLLIEAPIVGPLYLLILRVANPVVVSGFTWMLIMFMRPIFIATLHEIYEDFRPLPPSATESKPLHLIRRGQVFRRNQTARAELRLRGARDQTYGRLIHLTALVSRYGRRL